MAKQRRKERTILYIRQA